jgi:peptidoglycan/LPS O-acetylase OafA/YrhL
MSAGPLGLEPPPGNPRFRHLDGLRALAALSVVVFHSAATTPGWPQATRVSFAYRVIQRGSGGVTLFFLLSGFLLYRPFVQARIRREPGPSIGRFWWRRVLRVVPAYWVALTLLAIWPGLRGVHSGDWWRYYLLLQTWSVSTVTGGLSQAWTLCVEAQFYLLLPLFAVAFARLDRSLGPKVANRAEWVTLAVIFAGSVLYMDRHVLVHGISDVQLAARLDTLPATLQWFVLGMALAAFSARDPQGRSAPAGWLRRPAVTLAAWAVAAAIYVFLAEHSDTTTGSYVGLGVLYLLVLAPPTVAPSERGPQRLLLHPVIAWLGLVSYGIYLWHGEIVGELILHGLGGPGAIGTLEVFVVGATIATAVAAISYYVVERPFLRLKGIAPPNLRGR